MCTLTSWRLNESKSQHKCHWQEQEPESRKGEGTQWTKNRDLFMCLLTSLMLSDPQQNKPFPFEIINFFKSPIFHQRFQLKVLSIINYAITFTTLPKILHFQILIPVLITSLLFIFPLPSQFWIFGLFQDICTPKWWGGKADARLDRSGLPSVSSLQAPGPHHLPSSPICERRETRAPLL